MARIDRLTAMAIVGENYGAISALDFATPEPTNMPQPDTNIVEYAAVAKLDDGRTLKAYYYQQAEALQQVNGDASLLHWDVRDYEVLS